MAMQTLIMSQLCEDCLDKIECFKSKNQKHCEKYQHQKWLKQKGMIKWK